MLEICSKFKGTFVEYEVEKAKYITQIKNANEALLHLDSETENIRQKEGRINSRNDISVLLIWEWSYLKSKYYLVKLYIKINRKDEIVYRKFESLIKEWKQCWWEEPHFKFTKFSSEQINDMGLENYKFKTRTNNNDKLVTYRISNYAYSIKCGHKYLWQSFPKTPELLFHHFDDSPHLIEGACKKFYYIGLYKIAQVLLILLSRFHQSSANVWMIKIVSRLVVEYPSQMLWYVLHFECFYYINLSNKGSFEDRDYKKRTEFITRVMGITKRLDNNSYIVVQEAKMLFKIIIKFSKKSDNVKPGTSTLPSSIVQQIFDKLKILMPTQENLTPRIAKNSESYTSNELQNFHCTIQSQFIYQASITNLQ